MGGGGKALQRPQTSRRVMAQWLAGATQTAHWDSAFADHLISLHVSSKKAEVQPSLSGLTLLAQSPGPPHVYRKQE